MNYSPIKIRCLALIYATQKLYNYLLARYLNLVITSSPLEYLLSPPTMSGCISNATQLSKFNIVVVILKGLRS